MTLSAFTMAKLSYEFSNITCGQNCWEAKETSCRCECGGRNHGINLRGGNAIRTMRSGGVRYELVSVGKYKDLREQVEQLIRDADVKAGKRRLINGEYWSRRLGLDEWFKSAYVHPTDYNSGRGEYLLKYASMPQCLKWKELEYFEVASDRERYSKEPAILWKRSPLPAQ